MTANIKVAERKCYINGQFVGSDRQFAKIQTRLVLEVGERTMESRRFTKPTAQWWTPRYAPRRVR